MTDLRSFAAGLIALGLVLLGPIAGAQDGNLKQFDASDLYFQAWLTVRDAERLETDGKFLDAFRKFEKAKSLFDTVALYHPQWKTTLVKDRQESTKTSMEGIRDKALAEQEAVESRMADLVENQPTRPAAPAIDELDPAELAKVADLQKKINALRSQLGSGGGARDATSARMRRELAALETARNAMARVPIDGQMRELNDRISALQQERDAMAMALRDSRSEHQKALAELATMRADADAARRKAAELEQSLATERKVSNEVVAGLRNQLGALKEALKQKDELLSAAHVRTAELERELEESRAEVADLRDERRRLLTERDQMAALLKLNESERVQALIEQNMKLGRDLKDAQDRLAAVAADNDGTKDQLLEAKRDLALAKARIIELQRDDARQQERLIQLESRLEQAGEDLEADAVQARVEADPKAREEIDMLRGIISRQLRVQQRRRQAKEILFTEVKRLGLEDRAFMGALSMATGQELKLTEEENQLLADRKIDDEFVFSDHPSAEERNAAGRQLQQRIEVKSALARRAFANGRYFVAREFFESIVEEDHPGHVQSLINLGVVCRELGDQEGAIRAFKDALAIRGDQPLPHAHFLLAVAHYDRQEFDQARTHLDTVVGIDPSNAKAHIFLGSIAGNLPDLEAAERHFQEAIRLDPTLTEPFYNLAVIRAEQGRHKEALDFYRTAIENGAAPDVAFESRIGQ